MSASAVSDVDRFVSDPGSLGRQAPPRQNGELVFEAPWESRAFGIAVSLAQREIYDWDEFRERLIDEIGDWEAGHEGDVAGWHYYERWLVALERLLVDERLLEPSEIEARAAEIEAHAAHEHDHDHDHHHHHTETH